MTKAQRKRDIKRGIIAGIICGLITYFIIMPTIDVIRMADRLVKSERLREKILRNRLIEATIKYLRSNSRPSYWE